MKNARRLLSLLLVAGALSACSASPTAPVEDQTAFSPAPPPPPPVDPGTDG